MFGRADKWQRDYKHRQKLIKQVGSDGVSANRLTRFLLPIAAIFALTMVGAAAYLGYQKYSTVPLEFSGNTIFVRQGGDLQAAINRAKPGDTIQLQAGATFKGNFRLPVKNGNEYITIRTSANDSQLPPADTRIDPKRYAAILPKIVTPNSQPAIYTDNGAHHYRFVGIEFTPATADYVYNLVQLGSDKHKNLQEVARHLEVDRCYIHPNPKGKTRRGVALNSAETIVKNSHIAGFGYQGEETQAIAGWNGPGPYKIVNNYLEAGAENVLFGGGDPSIKGLVPSDIEVRNNTMTKPLDWRRKATVKCAFELKNARRVVVTGNIMENAFDDTAIRITVRNQDGGAPWSTIEDVLIKNNIIRNSGGGIRFLGKDDQFPSEVMKRIKIVNNLFADINSRKWGGDGRFIITANGVDLQIINNTIFHSGNIINAHSAPTKGFVFRDNIVSYNEYGYNGDDAGVGQKVLTKYFPDGQFSGNVFVNGNNIPTNYMYIPPRNSLAQSFPAVGFVDLANGNFRLARNSRFIKRGNAGLDPGCNIDELEREIKVAK